MLLEGPKKFLDPESHGRNRKPYDYRAVLFTYFYYEKVPSSKVSCLYTTFEKWAPGHDSVEGTRFLRRGTVRDCQASHDKIRVRGDDKA